MKLYMEKDIKKKQQTFFYTPSIFPGANTEAGLKAERMGILRLRRSARLTAATATAAVVCKISYGYDYGRLQD